MSKTKTKSKTKSKTKTKKRHYKKHNKSHKHRAHKNRSYRKRTHRNRRRRLLGSKGVSIFTIPEKTQSEIISVNNRETGNMIPGLRNM